MLSLLIFNKIILAIPFVCVWTKVSSLMVWHSCSLKLYYGEKNDKVPSTLFIIIYHDEDLPTRYRHSLLRPGGHLGRLLFIFLNRHMRNMLSRFSAKTETYDIRKARRHSAGNIPVHQDQWTFFFFPPGLERKHGWNENVSGLPFCVGFWELHWA